MLPNRVRLSRSATARLATIKIKTGLTPNILARFAIMLTINEGSNLSNTGVSDNEGQELSQSVLFGNNTNFYDLLIAQYMHHYKLSDLSVHDVIVAMIESGVYKMGQIKSLQDFSSIL